MLGSYGKSLESCFLTHGVLRYITEKTQLDIEGLDNADNTRIRSKAEF